MSKINSNNDRLPLVKFETKFEISRCNSTSVDFKCLQASEVSHNANTTNNIGSL